MKNFKLNSVAVFFGMMLGVAGTVTRSSAVPIPLSDLLPTYDQNFNGLTTNLSDTWTQDSTLSGWYARNLAGSTSDVTTISANNGGNFAGLMSLGSNLNNLTQTDPTGLDRSLGTRNNSTTGSLVFGVVFRNTSALTLTSLSITYTGEQYRQAGIGNVVSTPAADNLTFGYKTGSTLPTNSTALSGTFIAVSALDFVAPLPLNTATTTDLGAIDGNAAANRVAGITTTISGISVAPNQYVVFRWLDTNTVVAPSTAISDHSLAIDDLSVVATFAVAPEPTSAGVIVAAAVSLLRRRRD